jgi:sulfonate transport system permease protein
MKSMTTALRHNAISIAVVALLIVAWEVAGHLAPKSPLRESPIVPPWEFVFGRALIGLSDYWKIQMWAPVPQLGGQQTLLGAVLAILLHSALTLYRLILGFVIGGIVGVGLGLALSWSATVRGLIAPSLHIVRMCPLLALVPLFQFWFSATNTGAIVFVAYGVGVVFLVGTINAVKNVPVKYIESALTMGASRLLIYRSVILPAILPELFSSVFLTLGLAWAAVIGAEYVGVESGIGRMIIWSEYFSNTGRMALIALIILFYALGSFALCRRLQVRLLRWQPKLQAGGPIA